MLVEPFSMEETKVYVRVGMIFSVMMLVNFLSGHSFADWARAASLQEWLTLPEYPNLREACLPSLRSATVVGNLKDRGATYIEMIRWAEQEAERVAMQNPTDEALPVGMNEVFLHLVRRAQYDKGIYEKIPGGFPQWIFRSCMKNMNLN